jgi:prolyl-tRNA synthetase
MIIALNLTSKKVKDISEEVYASLTKAGYDVLFDDRDISAGIKFKDADLIGIPLQVIVGEKNAKKNIVEIKSRKDKSVIEVAPSDVEKRLAEIISSK